jgi:hypothetical protein
MKRILIYFQLFILFSSIFLAAVPSVSAPNGEPYLVFVESQVGWNTGYTLYELHYPSASKATEESFTDALNSLNVATLTEAKGKINDITIEWLFEDMPYLASVDVYGIVNESVTLTVISEKDITGTKEECTLGNCSDKLKFDVLVKEQTGEGEEAHYIIGCYDRKAEKDHVTYYYHSWGVVGSHPEVRYKDIWVPLKDYSISNSKATLSSSQVDAYKTVAYTNAKTDNVTLIRFKGSFIGQVNPDGSYEISLDHVPLFASKEYAEFAWWNALWSHRIEWTAANPTAETLTNFPILLNVTIPDESQDDCDDMVFTDLSNNILPFELDNEDDVNALFWVNDSIPASSSISGWLYYGNDAATSQANPEGVWDSNYVLVSHMRDDPDTSHVKDSTSYANNGVKKAANEPAETAAGAVGRAQDFDGNNDYINCGAGLTSTFLSGLTVEAITNYSGSGGNWVGIIDQCRGASANGGFGFRIGHGISNSKVALMLADGLTPSPYFETTASIPAANTHLAAIWDGSTESGSIKIYFNCDNQPGTEYNYGTNLKAATLNTLIGQSVSYYIGTIDEVRVSSCARSANWTKSGYEFVVNQSTWVTWGAAETCPCPPNDFIHMTGAFWAEFGSAVETGWPPVIVDVGEFLPNDEDCPLTTDGFNLSWTNGTDSGWINGSLPFGPITIETPPCSWVNITVWGYNATYDVLSCDSLSDSVYVDYPAPAITYDTGNFFANFSFDAGDYADATDGFNVSWVDGTGSGWVNTTDSYVNFSYGPHETVYVNITVWSWNSTWDVLSCDYATASARLPNNAPIISGCDNVSFDPENKTVYIYLNYTDLDGDVCMFSTDFPYGSLDPATGVFVWVINGTMNEYYASFTVNDSYGGNDTCIASLMEIYLYFQALSVTEEQEMLGYVCLFIFLLFLAILFMFTAFLAPNNTLKLFSGFLSGLLFFVEGRGLIAGVFGDQLEMAWLSIILTALGIVMAIFTILSVISVLYMMFSDKSRAGTTGLPYDPDSDEW